MKIDPTQSSIQLISNPEVLHHIHKVHTAALQNPQYGDHERAKLRQLHAVITEVHGHLNPLAPSLAQRALSSRADHASTAEREREREGVELASVPRILGVLKGYQLTKGEQGMIVNLRPRTEVELECIVEECEERVGGTEALLEALEGAYNAEEERG